MNAALFLLLFRQGQAVPPEVEIGHILFDVATYPLVQYSVSLSPLVLFDIEVYPSIAGEGGVNP